MFHINFEIFTKIFKKYKKEFRIIQVNLIILIP